MNDWVVILGALGLFVPILAAAIVNIIIALKTGAKVDAAAQRREEIANTIIDPTTLPPKAP